MAGTPRTAGNDLPPRNDSACRPEIRPSGCRPRRSPSLVLLLCGLCCLLGFELASAEQPATSDRDAKIAALNAEKNDAVEKVKAIVNQRVVAYVRRPGMQVSVFSPGWFHPGASTPDFDHVDVRQTQEAIYDKSQFVSSDLNPGIVFIGNQLEFNSMTKYFYTDRSLPKKKLSEAEMVEINRLYRIIGRCEREVIGLEQTALAEAQPGEVESDSAPVRQPVPRSNYIKAGIGIAIVLVLYAVYRRFR